MQDPDEENYKTLRKDIKEQMNGYSMFFGGKIILLRCEFFPT